MSKEKKGKSKEAGKKKLQLAFYWAASCGGCEIAVLDIDEKILDVVAIADVLFWPVAMDFKYKDVEAMPDNHIDVCFFNGSVRTEEQEQIAKLLRKKSKVLVAFGACAVNGGIPGLANVANREENFNVAYLDNPSIDNPKKVTPKTSVKIKEGTLTLPEFYDTVRSLNQVVDVDYFLPGCPPTPDLIMTAVGAIAENKLPPKGSVIGPLIVAGIIIKQSKIKNLVDIGVKDSKQASRKKRNILFYEILDIVEFTCIYKIEPAIIDNNVYVKNLNKLEGKVMATIINHLEADVTYVDSCDVNTNRYTELIRSYLKSSNNNMRIVVMHKADILNIAVSAASIIAKVIRDKEIEMIQREFEKIE